MRFKKAIKLYYDKKKKKKFKNTLARQDQIYALCVGNTYEMYGDNNKGLKLLQLAMFTIDQTVV